MRNILILDINRSQIKKTPQSLQYHCVRERFEVVLPCVRVLLTEQSLNDKFDALTKSLATELALDAIKTRGLSLMVVYYEDADVKAETSPKKVYMIIDGEKVYVDSEIVKKYDLDRQKSARLQAENSIQRKIDTLPYIELAVFSAES